MTWRPNQSPALPRPQTHVHLFERSKEAGKRMLQMNRSTPGLPEILRPELILARNHGGPQRPVFMRPLGPHEVRFPIDPQGKSHTFS